MVGNNPILLTHQLTSTVVTTVEASIRAIYQDISSGESKKMLVWENTVAIVLGTTNPAARIARNAPKRVIRLLVAVSWLFLSDKVLLWLCKLLFKS